MSKFDELWIFIQSRTDHSCKLSFDEIGEISGVPIDHSFLNYKKELTQFGWQVSKISIKDRTVTFEKLESGGDLT
jgi:hypothetical protein